MVAGLDEEAPHVLLLYDFFPRLRHEGLELVSFHPLELHLQLFPSICVEDIGHEHGLVLPLLLEAAWFYRLPAIPRNSPFLVNSEAGP